MKIQVTVDGSTRDISLEELNDLVSRKIVGPESMLVLDGRFTAAKNVPGVAFSSSDSNFGDDIDNPASTGRTSGVDRGIDRENFHWGAAQNTFPQQNTLPPPSSAYGPSPSPNQGFGPPPPYYQPFPQRSHSILGIGSFIFSVLILIGIFAIFCVAGIVGTQNPEILENEESPIVIGIGLAVIGCVGLSFLTLFLGIIDLCLPKSRKLFGSLAIALSSVEIVGVIGLIILGNVIG